MVTKQVIVATEASDFQQAIYVDGLRRWEGGTAFALDIVTAAGNGTDTIALRCVNVDLPDGADGFPETLDELRPLVSPVDEPIAAPVVCPACFGTGKQPGVYAWQKCGHCKGAEMRSSDSPVDEPLEPAADEIRPSSRSWDDRDCVCETCSEEFPSCGNHPITCDVCMAYTCRRCLQDQVCSRCREAVS